MGIGALLDTVFSLYRRNFWLFVGVVAVVQVPYQILAALLASNRGTPPRLFSHLQGGHGTSIHILAFTQWAIHASVLGVIGLLLFALIALPLELAAFTRVVADLCQDQPTSIRLAFQAALGRWLPLLGLGLILGAIAFGALGLLGLVNALLVISLRGHGLLLALLIWLVAMVLGVMAYLRVLVSGSVVVLEPVDPWLAIRRSWELSKGSAWRILGVVVVLFILVVVLAIVGGILAAAFAVLGGGTSQPAGALILLIWKIVIAVLISPIVLGGLVLLYFDLLARREGASPLATEAQPALQP